MRDFDFDFQVDTFVVTTTTGRTEPTLCGSGAGQHMYIDAGAVSTDQVKTINPVNIRFCHCIVFQVTLTFSLNAGGTATSTASTQAAKRPRPSQTAANPRAIKV